MILLLSFITMCVVLSVFLLITAVSIVLSTLFEYIFDICMDILAYYGLDDPEATFVKEVKNHGV